MCTRNSLCQDACGRRTSGSELFQTATLATLSLFVSLRKITWTTRKNDKHSATLFSTPNQLFSLALISVLVFVLPPVLVPLQNAYTRISPSSLSSSSLWRDSFASCVSFVGSILRKVPGAGPVDLPTHVGVHHLDGRRGRATGTPAPTPPPPPHARVHPWIGLYVSTDRFFFWWDFCRDAPICKRQA